MTTNQILIGVGLILALAAGSQVLANRLRIPAIIVLLTGDRLAGQCYGSSPGRSVS